MREKVQMAQQKGMFNLGDVWEKPEALGRARELSVPNWFTLEPHFDPDPNLRLGAHISNTWDALRPGVEAKVWG